MKRSREPVFWTLFGAGGMLSALVGPVLIFTTGIAIPIGFLLPQQTMDYTNMLALMRMPVGKVAALTVISLFLFHGCHRMVHSPNDLGLLAGRTRRLFYGAAILGTLVTSALLLMIGF